MEAHRRPAAGSPAGDDPPSVVLHDLAHDAVSDIVIIGTQDNGTHIQQASGLPRWLFINGGDGGDVAVDDSSLGATASFRF